ncbi:MAG: LPS export ABC transporter permease LptG [Desulfobacter sp.]|nr:LPS export ABC transporter permease LptG [Desulfobacter sp.]WDP85515.1 MAG: LPS export ABC transporter permease LptG [Desulfobacter sp.]
MKCLHRYWLAEFVKYFCIIQMMILVLFVFIDYLSRMDNFIQSDITMARGMWYVLLKLPFMFVQLTPASLLLAVIAAFGIMNRNGELTALKSSGISVYFLVTPALLSGLVLACLMFIMGETLIPVSMAKANHIRYQEMASGPKISQERKDIWIKSGKDLVHINFFDPVRQEVAGITATKMGKDFKIASRMDARSGRFENGLWVFEGVIEQVYDLKTDDYIVTTLPRKLVELKIEPKDLGRMAQKSNEMSFSELKLYVKKVVAEGYDATTYKVDMNGKLAFPFICVIMALTGAATGMRSFVKTNLPIAIAVGVVICFFYWFVYGFSMSLGYAKILPPIVAAWVGNLIFFCLGLIYLINTE